MVSSTVNGGEWFGSSGGVRSSRRRCAVRPEPKPTSTSVRPFSPRSRESRISCEPWIQSSHGPAWAPNLDAETNRRTFARGTKWLTARESALTTANPYIRASYDSERFSSVASIYRRSSSPDCTPGCSNINLEHGWFLGQGWGVRTHERANPWVNTRGFSRFWGDRVRGSDVVGWGDGDARGVLYVRVQGGPRN